MDSTLVSAVNTAVDGAADGILGMITTNAPIIIGVVVAMVALGFGIKLIKKVARG